MRATAGRNNGMARSANLRPLSRRQQNGRRECPCVCRSIRSIDDDGAIICISDDADDRDTSLNAGADLFMKMPEAVGQLRRTIDDVLDGPRSEADH